jgi:hypothetical protein
MGHSKLPGIHEGPERAHQGLPSLPEARIVSLPETGAVGFEEPLPLRAERGVRPRPSLPGRMAFGFEPSLLLLLDRAREPFTAPIDEEVDRFGGPTQHLGVRRGALSRRPRRPLEPTHELVQGC